MRAFPVTTMQSPEYFDWDIFNRSFSHFSGLKVKGNNPILNTLPFFDVLFHSGNRIDRSHKHSVRIILYKERSQTWTEMIRMVMGD